MPMGSRMGVCVRAPCASTPPCSRAYSLCALASSSALFRNTCFAFTMQSPCCGACVLACACARTRLRVTHTRAHTHTHTHVHTHTTHERQGVFGVLRVTHTRARAHTHTHTHTYTRAHTHTPLMRDRVYLELQQLQGSTRYLPASFTNSCRSARGGAPDLFLKNKKKGKRSGCQPSCQEPNSYA